MCPLLLWLVNTAEALANDDPLTWELAASGFRDTSRVAGGSIPMMMDILTTNRGPILDALKQAQSQMGRLAQYLEENDTARVQAALEAARSRRREVYR